MFDRVVARIKKQKSGGISTVESHNKRTVEVQNVTPGGRHETVYEQFPGLSLSEKVQKRIEKTGAKVIASGKNETTVLVEIMLSASPTYFRDNPLDYGKFDEKKMQAWLDANIKFLQKKYGENLLTVDVHLDEMTPHLHATMTPIATKQKAKRRTKEQIKNEEQAETYETSVFDCKNIFNNEGLIRFQDETAEAVQHLGIRRGIAGLRLENQTIKDHYAFIEEVNREAEKLLELKNGEIKLGDKPMLESFDAYRQREESRLEKYVNRAIHRLNNKVKKIYAAYKHWQARALSAETRLDAFTKVAGAESPALLENRLKTLENALAENESLQFKLMTKDFAIEELTKKVDSLEAISPEDRLQYKIEQAKRNIYGRNNTPP